MKEIWKDIEGYEGFYQVSNLGNVKSLNYRGIPGKHRVITPKTNNDGRLWVLLYKNGTSKAMLIHRLVGKAFLPNPYELPQINHKDENPMNNSLENLEWCTHEYNLMYTYKRHPEKYNVKEIKHGGHQQGRKTTGRKNEKRIGLAVNQYDKDGNLIMQWPNTRAIQVNTGMSDWSISECCRGKRKTAYGFRWQYAM